MTMVLNDVKKNQIDPFEHLVLRETILLFDEIKDLDCLEVRLNILETRITQELRKQSSTAQLLCFECTRPISAGNFSSAAKADIFEG